MLDLLMRFTDVLERKLDSGVATVLVTRRVARAGPVHR
jgi:hypothetical protein